MRSSVRSALFAFFLVSEAGLFAQTVLTLPANTPVNLLLTQTISSSQITIGSEVKFQVLNDVTSNGFVLIPRGSFVSGTVQAVRRLYAGGKGGMLKVKLDAVPIAGGLSVPLSARPAGQVVPLSTTMTAGVIPTPIAVNAAAPLAVSAAKTDVSLPKGMQIVAYVQRSIAFNVEKLAAKAANPTAAPALVPPASGFLTNADILAMCQTGVDADRIVKAIQTMPSHFQVEGGDIAVLKKANVPAAVIQAMIVAARQAP